MIRRKGYRSAHIDHHCSLSLSLWASVEQKARKSQMMHVIEIELAGRTLRLETGRVAKQADGSVLASYGDTVILATAVASQTVKPGIDFLPLTVDYQEKAYAAGKIP